MPHEQLTTGVSLYVEDMGAGPSVVLVHGWSMSGRFFVHQLSALSSMCRVLVPDLRGHGQSEKVLHGHTMATYARDLEALPTARRVDRPVLVGWSMGAFVLYEYLNLAGQESASGPVIVDENPSDFAWEGYEFGGVTIQDLAEVLNRMQDDQRGLAHEFVDAMIHTPYPVNPSDPLVHNQRVGDRRAATKGMSGARGLPRLAALSREPPVRAPC